MSATKLTNEQNPGTKTKVFLDKCEQLCVHYFKWNVLKFDELFLRYKDTI